jgi:SAM-dependent methyltransferase
MTTLTAEMCTWLATQSKKLDEVVAETCADLIKGNQENRTSWTDWEVDQGLNELAQMDKGEDCFYDHASIGVTYALYFHGLRTHEALRVLLPRIALISEPTHIVDLGCGTGATAWAVTLSLEALKHLNQSPPQITVEGVDSSPIMVATAKALHESLCFAYSLDVPNNASSFRADTWDKIVGKPEMRTVVVGAHLFDHSDEGKADDVAHNIDALGNRIEASETLFITTQQKVSIVQSVTGHLKDRGWTRSPEHGVCQPMLKGPQQAVHDTRRNWYRERNCTRHGLFKKPPELDAGKPRVIALRRRPGSAIDGRLFTLEGQRFPPDEDQRAATTRIKTGPTAIIGAAGSGKSRVLVERVVATVVSTQPDEPAPVILVTAFNKDLIDLLARWIEEALGDRSELSDLESRSRARGQHTISAALGPCPVLVELMNRDLIPTRLLHLQGEGNGPHFETELHKRTQQLGWRDREIAGTFDKKFLEQEFERVILAKACTNRDEYRSVIRTGRREQLDESRRDVVWALLMNELPSDPFIGRRIDACGTFKEEIENQAQLPVTTPYTGVFVDECQDFTSAEFQLLARIPQDPRRLCVAGDESQSLRLGRSYHRPLIAGTRWTKHELTGSYRLPSRVAEALLPLAEHIASQRVRASEEVDTVRLRSRKAAVLGSRPIIVSGTVAQTELREILDVHQPRSMSSRLLMTECGRRTCDAVKKADSRWEADTLDTFTMDRAKGCEWEAVVVSNERPSVDRSESLPERIFTALTRTTSLLIIVVWDDGDADIASLVGRLREDRLLFWSEAAETAFTRARYQAVSSPHA